MPYDEHLARRIRSYTAQKKSMTEKKMFGGLGFLLHGNMCVGIWRDSLIARVGPEAYQTALAESCVTEFDITGKPMTGWVMVLPEAIAADAELKSWIDRAARFVRTLPAK